ncbi:hypothetical protein ROHU_005019 [Labeo rohita]|uniref:Uncharacterized protein n=1 Tax=Labeo rohita TaxID=84645 RepID=A0A498NCH4_LABRO|nr:hypothetical protein ROHU_005019 [Labeo rohita]
MPPTYTSGIVSVSPHSILTKLCNGHLCYLSLSRINYTAARNSTIFALRIGSDKAQRFSVHPTASSHGAGSGPWFPSEARPLGSAGQVTCTHSRGLQRDSDCITASLAAAEVAENGTMKKGESERKTETGA